MTEKKWTLQDYMDFERGIIERMSSELKKQSWIQGYACAVATLHRIEDGAGKMLGVRALELMVSGGLTRKACEAAGVDEYDMAALFPADVTPKVAKDE